MDYIGHNIWIIFTLPLWLSLSVIWVIGKFCFWLVGSFVFLIINGFNGIENLFSIPFKSIRLALENSDRIYLWFSTIYYEKSLWLVVITFLLIGIYGSIRSSHR
jgi:hypothetical protein